MVQGIDLAWRERGGKRIEVYVIREGGKQEKNKVREKGKIVNFVFKK